MGHSDRLIYFARLIPGGAWKDALLERHLERCPDCAVKLASREETRRLLVGSADVGDLEGIWPAVRAAIAAPGPRRPDVIRKRIPAWRWMTAAAGFALAVFLTWSAVRFFQPGAGLAGFEVASVAGLESEAGPPAGDVQLSYVRIDNEPARAIVYKPHDSNLVLIWAGRN
jgi:anti-sigma factor RsiW